MTVYGKDCDGAKRLLLFDARYFCRLWIDDDAAFLRRIQFPPPASGALVFARLYGAGARPAADTCKTFVVELVIRNIIGLDVIPDVLACPLCEWIKLDDSAVLFIDIDHRRL